MKKNILFGIVGWNIAETTRMIEIAKKVSDEFQVYFASYGGQFDHLVKESGFELFSLDPQETPEKIQLLWKIDRGEKYAHPFSVSELRQRVKNELELFDKIKPAAVVMGSVLSFPISARVSKIPLVNVIPFALSECYFKNNLPLVPEYPKALNRIFKNMILKLPIVTKNFNIVARDYGLPKFPNIVSVWKGDYNLLTELPSLFPNVKLEENWEFVGPIYAKLEGEIPLEVKEFIENSTVKTAYFAMGSSANAEVLKKVVESFDGLPLNVVAPIKSHLEKINVNVPSNILVCDWLPAHKVNPMCDIAIIHGGQGTVQTACDSGTPFIGIGMQPEQSVNIESIVRYGSAIRIPRRKFNRDIFHKSILKLLSSPDYRVKAIALKEESSKMDGAVNVGRFIKEKFL